ncbi:DoxX-like family protein [Mucilaginibacter sp. RB4R14]|uniref:DoxX-like family protein n=1 Tax=Mucilaginibacter aurantiaciroseus TaxID=2949308 RepID=UPI002090D5B1|nr:DoxX-like family protein [Mucilaginibacter aurantiaciroseus]MCO5935134.1 DoxX-like family protein [Mucilaginibacter aurantiaciroseus]
MVSISRANLKATLNIFIAIVWVANGLFCKVINLVPRHQQIVGKILGTEYATIFTKIIGVLEILMAVWILSRFLPRLNAITQIIVIATMNIMEFVLVPDLLLFGRMNLFFALMFIALIYYNKFVMKANPILQQ